MIPYGRQEVTDADVEAVVRALRSDFLTQGPAVPSFEAAVAARVGAAHAVAVNSATSALHIACLALGLGPGDRLWTVPTSFVASANCARYCGAEVGFVDIHPDTWNIDVEALARALSQASAANRLPKVLVPVHLTGQPTEQEAIHALCRQYGVKLLEDASHSIGAARNGEPVGNCRWSDITVFSFHPVKIITSAEGGMALTKDPALAQKLQMLRSHGITRDARLFQCADPADPPGWHYEQQLLGYNYRMTDIQAVLGESQLQRLERYVERRNELAARYDHALAGLPLQLPTIQAQNRSAYHIYVVRLRGRDAARHRRVFDGLRARGIGVNLHYMPIHLQPYYRALGFGEGQFPEAEAYGESAITLPLYPALPEADQDRVVQALQELL
jgi:UDP-4-amino-4,6-dideoxy-N-acetyl-beta-L-altrosamine transaminase